MSFPDRLEIPEDVLEIARVLEGAGHEAWCVGGAIRDQLLGEGHADYDVATSATPDAVRALFAHTVAVGERFGTVAVRVQRRHHEVTTFRRDVRTDGRHAEVEFGASLEEDLARRDFTINAIAYHPLRQEWRDPFGGQGDLEARRLRAVGDPALRFREDYLRVLRGCRFAARFRLTIEPATWTAMQDAAAGLSRLSAERVREEWFKGLRTAETVRDLVEKWRECGAAAVWLPELIPDGALPAAAMPAEGEGRHPFAGRGAERARALPAVLDDRTRALPRDPVLLTVLLTVDPVPVLVRFKASNAEIARAAAVVAGPAEPASTTPIAVRQWMAAVGEAVDDLGLLWRLQHGSEAPWTAAVRGVRERGEPLSRKDLAVTGSDLRELGIPPGPQLGTILDRLTAIVVDDPDLNTRATLLARARAFL